MTFWGLVENESLKLIRRRRFAIVVAILVVVLSLVTYGGYQQLKRRARDARDWRVTTQQRIANMENIIRRGRASSSWEKSLRAEIKRLQFYLDRGIEPEKPTAPIFVRQFANIAGFLLLPLLVGVLGSDIVSAETAEGTDKLLLTRPVRRWKILLSKLAALYIFATLTLLCGGVLGYGIASIALDPRGWEAPTFTGFQLRAGNVDLSEIRQLPLWLDTLIAFGLEWFALLAVASIALMLSVLLKSSAASIGTMLAALIGGTILTRLAPDWTAGKYLFVSAMPLAAYYSGEPPPYDGMSLVFCVQLLGIWAIAALAVAFVRFTRRDVFG